MILSDLIKIKENRLKYSTKDGQYIGIYFKFVFYHFYRSRIKIMHTPKS